MFPCLAGGSGTKIELSWIVQSIHIGFRQGQAHSKKDTKQNSKKKIEKGGGGGWGRSAIKLVSTAVMFAIFFPSGCYMIFSLVLPEWAGIWNGTRHLFFCTGLGICTAYNLLLQYEIDSFDVYTLFHNHLIIA